MPVVVSFRRFGFAATVAVLIGTVGLLAGDIANDRSVDPEPDRFIARPVAPAIWSGPTPSRPADFRRLKELGITRILCVDGQTADVDAAAEMGIETFHRPIGYDAVGPRDAACFVAIGRELRDGSDHRWFVHCHHGRHRGPVAAAMVAMSADRMNVDSAVRWLHVAGTSRRYIELWQSVREFDVARYANASMSAPLSIPPAEISPRVRRMITMRRAMETIDEDDDHAWLMIRQAVDESIRNDVEAVGVAGREYREHLLRLRDAVADRRPAAELQQHCDRCHDRFR